MANVINATSAGNGGLVSTGDDSGILNIQTNEVTAVTIDASQNLTFTNAANLPNTFGFKNRIINGAMGIWQRGTSQASFGYGSVDRWLLNSSNSTLARSTDVPSGFKYSALLTGTSALNAQITQRIEAANCYDLAGQSVTVSFWVKSSSGTSNLIVYANYANASDDFTSSTFIGQTTVTSPASTWTQYSFTLNNLPAGSANGLQIGMYRSGTDTSTTYITGVQLEKGTAATSFDFRSYGTELALCQRYFISYGGQAVYEPFALGVGLTSTAISCQIQLPVPMRTAITGMTALNPTNTATNIGAPTSIVFDTASDKIVMFTVNVASGSGANLAARLYAGGSGAPRLQFSTEL